MTSEQAEEFVRKFIARYKEQFGEDPTPFAFAANLANQSDSNTMLLMSKFMEA